ncbi:hypothetical protein FACS189491_05360 [Spirochaetia bacterium]|nr:hypothetical protein FACS189491_05360 [Spirochaetia bacterium]
MGQNLRARLQRIREAGKELAVRNEATGAEPATDVSQVPPAPDAQNHSGESFAGSLQLIANSSFFEAGFQTLKRTTLLDLPLTLPMTLPQTLPILIPDLNHFRREQNSGQAECTLNPQDLLFFDLETTGLSGGAGTVAFLAAFGRFVPVETADGAMGINPFKLQIDQYLLLDYPGEGDFLEAALREFQPGSAEAKAPQGDALVSPLVVSYNGKSFDSQILKTRCLMNGMMPPVYAHADLLHPARRLWKRMLPDCSQATIETEILALDRTGDVPGALAPEIWFNFLKNNEAAPLLGICDHNLSDIQGLAAIFAALSHIAAEPLTAMDSYGVDAEQLALRWRGAWHSALRRGAAFGDDERRQGQQLLERAAEQGGQKAAYVLAMDLIRQGKAGEGRARLHALIAGDRPTVINDEVKCLALRQLAIDAEWHLRDYEAALAHTEAALAMESLRETMQDELKARRERLLLKNS